MLVTEKGAIDKEHECATVFKTTDSKHPGVKLVMDQGELDLAGPIKVLSTGGFADKYGALFMTPAQTRALFTSLGWSRVAAFQTRNPMHRSHEYLAKVAIEVCDGVLIHSLLGALKPGDIPAEVRTRAIAVLADRYFVKKTWSRPAIRSDMRYAGPREALLHALFRQNLRLLAPDRRPGPRRGRQLLRSVRRTPHLRPDPAGRAGDGAAQDRPVLSACYACGGMASGRTCPHPDTDRLQVSGTQLRKWLAEGAEVPPSSGRPEVLAILREYYAGADAAKGPRGEGARPSTRGVTSRCASSVAGQRERPAGAGGGYGARAVSGPVIGIPEALLANWTTRWPGEWIRSSGKRPTSSGRGATSRCTTSYQADFVDDRRARHDREPPAPWRRAPSTPPGCPSSIDAPAGISNARRPQVAIDNCARMPDPGSRLTLA